MSGLSEDVLKTIFPCLPNVLGAAEMKRIHDSLYTKVSDSLYPKVSDSLYPKVSDSLYPKVIDSPYPKVSDSLFTNTVLACTAATVESVLSFFLLLCQNPLCRVQMCGLHDAHSSIPVPKRNHFRGPFCISTLLAVHGRDEGGG